MSTDPIDQHNPVHLDDQKPTFLVEERYVPLSEQQKMQLPGEMKPIKPEPPDYSDPHRITSQSIPSGALCGPASDIIQNDIASLEARVKMEPDNNLIQYDVEFIDMDTKPVYKEDAGRSPELEASVVPKPDTVEPVPETVVQKTKIKRPKATQKYSESYLNETVNQIRNGMTMYAASKMTGIPRATLQYRMSSEFKNKGGRGRFSVFTANEETEIVELIKDMVRKGFPITRGRIEHKVSNYLKCHPRKSPFKDNKPGKQWIKCFVSRNHDLKITANLSASVTERDVRNWFRSILSYLEDNQLTDILKDPSRILYANEAGFLLHPTSKEVVDTLHEKNVSFIETTKGDHNITVMFTFVADGSFLPPDVVVRSKRLTKEIQESFPSDWGLGKSANGRLEVRNFTMYIMKVLYPTLVKRGTQFPVLYFVDGHNSEAAFEAADMCKQYGIILIALYPNAAQIIQQSNVAAYKSLKTTWDNVVRIWRLNHQTKRMRLINFGSLLKEAIDKSLNKSTITNAFTVSGLYPFNLNAINFEEYSSVFAANPASSNDSMAYTSNITDDTEETPCDSVGTIGIGNELNDRQIEVPESVLKTALRMLGPSKMNLYQTTLAHELPHEDKVLSYVFKNILILGQSPAHDAIQECANNPSTSNASGIRNPTSLAPEDDSVTLEFDVTMDIKTENDSEESTDMIVGSCDYGQENTNHCDKTADKVAEQALSPKNCQENEINSNYTGETSSGAVYFATEHICSFPRITTHFCPVANKTKYHSFFLDLTGMYVAYLDACQKSSQDPVSGKVYNEILLTERTKDPPLPARCDDCQHVEKYDYGELSRAFLNK